MIRVNHNNTLWSASNEGKRLPDDFQHFSSHYIGMGLEVGCGKNRLSPDVLAVDRSPDSDADMVCQADDLPFADRTFGFLFSCHCLKDCHDPKKVLLEWIRVVVPGGRIIVLLPNMEGMDADPKLAAWASTPAIVSSWTSEMNLELLDMWNINPHPDYSTSFGIVWTRLAGPRDQIERVYTPFGIGLVVETSKSFVTVVYPDLTKATFKKEEVNHDGYSRQTKDYHLLP